MSKSNPEYARGYQAGRRYRDKEIKELEAQLRSKRDNEKSIQTERLYFQALGVALEHCSGWQIEGKTLKCMDDYSSMAEIIVQAADKRLPTL